VRTLIDCFWVFPICLLGLGCDLLAWLFESLADGLRTLLPEDEP